MMIELFTTPELFRVIDTYTDLRSLCDTCRLFATICFTYFFTPFYISNADLYKIEIKIPKRIVR